jgi:hypothetical protein
MIFIKIDGTLLAIFIIMNSSKLKLHLSAGLYIALHVLIHENFEESQNSI